MSVSGMNSCESKEAMSTLVEMQLWLLLQSRTGVTCQDGR